MSTHIIALDTYGSQRVKHPRTAKPVSAYKMGYSSAASTVLLALYDDKAHNVSSKRSSYHYIKVDADVTVRRGYILLKVSDTELRQVEALTRQVHRPAVYRWRDDAWAEFPSLREPDYAPIIGRSGPSFNPTSMRIVSTSTGEAEAAVKGIIVEKSQRNPNEKAWFWLRGDTYPHRDTLKRWGCRWSTKRKAWYFIGWQLPDAVEALIDDVNANIPDQEPSPAPEPEMSDDSHDPCSVEEAAAILGMRVKESPQTDEPEADEAPKIRIVKPDLDASDALTAAIRQTKAEALPVMRSSNITNGKRALYRIPQSPCGELTGSITGNVWCYGWAIHEGICVYVNFGGPRMAVEAIRAKMSKGDIVNCVPWDAPAIELTAGEGNTGMYTAYLQHIPEAKFTSVILCHEHITQPNYGGDSVTFLIYMSDAQAMTQLRHHITKLVKVPVFAEWTAYLWQAGQSAMLLRPTRTGGDVKLYTLVLDADAWTRLITGGLGIGTINLTP